ncbi:MAG: SusD/RagB family nutrient-binding outer membrane lipoprotein [Candidatus Cyclobacteriaceae bacterium M3_2C_046]
MKLKIISIIMLSILLIAACENNFEEINSDPNRPGFVPTSYLLTGAQKTLTDLTIDQLIGVRVGMMFSQQWAQNGDTRDSRYEVNSPFNQSFWDDAYAKGLQNLQTIIDLNTENPDKYLAYGAPDNQIAVARILKAWFFQILTDMYGDIPYSQALQIDDNLAEANPVFDKQEDIYASLITELKEAAAMIKPKQKGFTSGDIIYNGDMTAWKKFANCLRLRVAMRMSEVAPQLAEVEVASALLAEGGLIDANENQAVFDYLSSTPNTNPIAFYYSTNNAFSVSEFLVDKLIALDDPRLSEYVAEAPNGGYKGFPYGLADPGSIEFNSTSLPSLKVRQADFPGIIMTHAEVLFLKAEAAQRGWGNQTQSAEALYDEAITSSMNFWGIEDQEVISNYLDQPEVDFNSNQWKKLIGTQKWLAMYMQGLQSWFEVKRLDYPQFEPANDPVAAQIIAPLRTPGRLIYPTGESGLNATGYEGSATTKVGDTYKTQVWWDKR